MGQIGSTSIYKCSTCLHQLVHSYMILSHIILLYCGSNDVDNYNVCSHCLHCIVKYQQMVVSENCYMYNDSNQPRAYAKEILKLFALLSSSQTSTFDSIQNIFLRIVGNAIDACNKYHIGCAKTRSIQMEISLKNILKTEGRKSNKSKL